jgi:cell division septum initiation protein DivIVA
MQEESSQEEPRMRPQGEEERRFTVVRRGYDRAEVDGYVREMWDRAVQLQENRPPTPAADLSRRLTHILEIANEEADDLRAEAQARSDEIIADAEARARVMIETSEERCDEVERKILELSAARDHLLAALSGLNQQLTRALEYHNSQTGHGVALPDTSQPLDLGVPDVAAIEGY